MATIPYRYTDGTIYIQGMQNTTTDKANILLARADWRADGVVPTEEFDDMFPLWYEEHTKAWKMAGMNEDTKAEAIRIGQPVGTNEVLARSFYPEPFYLTEMIYEVSTDNFVGFSRNWLNGGDAEHLVTCFHPDQRGKGYMNRFSVMSSKAWFLHSGGTSATHYTPKGQASYYVADPNIDIFKTRYDRIDRVDYIKTVFTKADYLAWMDLPANHADRDASFTTQRYLEV